MESDLAFCMPASRWRDIASAAMSWLILAIASAAVSASHAPGDSASAGNPLVEALVAACYTPSADVEVCFNNKASRIGDRIEELIDSAKTGSTIRMAMYTWTRTDIAEALRDAANLRNVTVQLVVQDPLNSAVMNILDQIVDPDFELVLCGPNSGCMPDAEHINHNKFLLFSDLGNGLPHVVQMSQNLTIQQQGLYQDLLRVRNDPDLYNAYVGYFDRLRVGNWCYAGNCWNTEPKRSSDGTNNYSRAFFFPRVEGVPSNDPILDILNNVEECRPNDDKIWVAVSKFSTDDSVGGRGGLLRGQLNELEDVYGCDVKVVVSGTTEREFLCTQLDQVGHLAAVHHKFLLIDAKFKGQWRNLVFTGSQNWNVEGQLQNDDAMIRLQLTGLFTRYRDYYNELYPLSAPCP